MPMFDTEWYKQRNEKLREEKARKERVQKQANSSSSPYDNDYIPDIFNSDDSTSYSSGDSSYSSDSGSSSSGGGE